jgi:hypothetical protein
VKKIIAEEFPSVPGGSPLQTQRRNSPTRQVHEAELDDIISLLDGLDQQDDLSKRKFVAIDLEKLPKIGPEELNIGAVVDR